ncbi:MAG: hypothetical protein ACSHX3_10535 [Litorimonas sp.]
MKRCLNFALLLAFAAPLSACGISGGVKTAPPLWGDAMADKVAEDAATEAVTNEADAASNPSSDNRLDVDEDEDEIGYGVDVADTP